MRSAAVFVSIQFLLASLGGKTPRRYIEACRLPGTTSATWVTQPLVLVESGFHDDDERRTTGNARDAPGALSLVRRPPRAAPGAGAGTGATASGPRRLHDVRIGNAVRRLSAGTRRQRARGEARAERPRNRPLSCGARRRLHPRWELPARAHRVLSHRRR